MKKLLDSDAFIIGSCLSLSGILYLIKSTGILAISNLTVISPILYLGCIAFSFLLTMILIGVIEK